MSPAAIYASDSAQMTQTNQATHKNSEVDVRIQALSDDPVRRIWRGDKEGNLSLKRCPKFDSPYEEREWIKAHMAAAFRFWGKKGFDQGLAGHITVKDPVLPDHYWMNPICVHFSSITKSKLVLVGPDGYVTRHGAQLPINTAGFIIHSSIHKARPEAQAIAHCHSRYGKAWSTFGRPIDILSQDACLFYDNLVVYANFNGVVLAHEEGASIAKALGSRKKTCILQNHGLLTVGKTVDEAAFLFSCLDRACEIQLLVEAAASNGIPKHTISDEDAAYTANTTQNWEHVYVDFQTEYDRLLEETNGAFLM